MVSADPPRDPFRNVPRGLYRNTLGAELRVKGTAMGLTGHNTLSGDIAIAEAVDDLLMIRTEYLVTIESLKDCGYELIEPEAT